MTHPHTALGNALAERLARYAGEALLVAGELPNSREGRHVRDQLIRSGTAPGAHYAEARNAQSSPDFVHKLSLAAKEARESLHWLRTSGYARLVRRDLGGLICEGEELVAVLSASLRTAQRHRDARSS